MYKRQVENIVFCCNRSTADHIISSPLFVDPTYERTVPCLLYTSISDAGKGGSPQLITEEPMEEPVYKVVEVMPEFPGGMNCLLYTSGSMADL